MFSIVFPPYLCYKKRTETSKEFPVVEIKDGVLLPTSGPVCKKIIGNRGGSLVHILWKEGSPETTIKFLTEIQFLTDHWLPTHGFSMGISDCQTTKFDQVREALDALQNKIEKLKTRYMGEQLESKISSLLNEAGNIGPLIAETSMNKGERNGLNIMRLSGAKGNIANLASIVAFIGQQNINGHRIPKTLSDGTRTLPRFEPGDTSPEALGFITNRYIDGLTPSQVCFHAMAGREGVIATAIRTAETGYIQKKISRKLEDLKVYCDGSVRNANGRIIQFIYGDDGLDPQKLYGCSGVEFPFFVNVRSIALRMNRDGTGKPRSLKKDEIDIILEYVKAGAPGIQTVIVKNTTTIFRAILRKEFKKIKLRECKIPDFCHEIVELLETSKAQHGDMVGLIAAASIGEPTTQLTLNFFHSTGHKGKDVSLGVPRFKEILNATESPKNPSCTIYFNDPILVKGTQTAKELEESLIGKLTKNNQRALEILLKKNKTKCIKYLEGKRKIFEEIWVGSFIIEYQLKYIASDVNPVTDSSPVQIITYMKYEKPWWVSLSEKLSKEKLNEPKFWVLEIRLNIEMMCKKSYTTEEIADIIEEKGEGCLSCIASPHNMGIIEIRTNFAEIRCFLKEKGHIMADNTLNPKGLPHRLIDTNLEFFLCRDGLVSFIKKIVIGGVPKISQVYPNENTETHEWVIETRGSNFQTILALPGIDPINTVTNEIWEIYRTLGIEAVRKFLIKETIQILSFGGTYINPRHIQLLVDSMTDTGTVTNVNRNGISRDEGPIKKIMFEQPIDNTVEAAAFVERDNLSSVSSSIMYGRIARAGTGMVEIQSIDRAPVKPLNIPIENTLHINRVIPKKKKKSKKINIIE